jgi:hypothetical protein
MNSGFPQLNDKPEKFISYLTSSEIYNELLKQINKDLERAGVDFTINSETQYSFEELVDLVFLQLKKAILHTSLSLANLLYIIDVDEKFTKESSSNSTDPLLFLSEIIVKRELQKVILRYKSRNN